MDKPLDNESRARAEADAEWIWRALTVEPGVGIGLIRVDGFVIYANERMCEMWTPSGQDTLDMTGKNVRDWYPPVLVESLLDVARRVVEGGKPIVRRGIFRGRQIESTHRAMESPENEPGRDLIVSRYTTDETTREGDESEFILEDAPFADFGPLDVLSTRELEVLALLGQGLKVSEVAKMIFRSPKTVENHRLSIGRKLDMSNRVQLAKLAFQAGLRLDDANLAHSP